MKQRYIAPLIQIQCDFCKTPFMRERKTVTYQKKIKQKLYCSNSCNTMSRKAPEVANHCKFCNKKFITSGKRCVVRFCSRRCASCGSVTVTRIDQFNQLKLKQKAAAFVRSQSPHLKRVCSLCNKDFVIPFSKRKGKGKFCSRSCARKAGPTKSNEVCMSCSNCGTSFQCPYNKRFERKFCTYECSVVKRYPGHYIERSNKDVICKICDISFVKKGAEKYCNYICSRKAMSNCAQKRIIDGTSACGRSKKYEHNSSVSGLMKVDGGWELSFCKWADSKQLHIHKNIEWFNYCLDTNVIRKYFPDFWFIYKEVKYYIEIKGKETQLDRIKWLNFPFKLVILRSNEIRKLNTMSIEQVCMCLYNKDTLPELKYKNSAINRRFNVNL